MLIHVDLVPRRDRHKDVRPDVVVVVDVLRACTLAPILFDNGLAQLTITNRIKLARQAGDGQILLGERNGLPPQGFNHGISPAELMEVDLSGKNAVMVSENVPYALRLSSGAQHALLASLYNAEAVTLYALSVARSKIDIVCCGYKQQEDLDDALTAGYLTALFKDLDQDVTLSGAARFSLSLLRAFPDPLEAFWQSISGHHLRKLNLVQDLAPAASISQSNQIPYLVEAISKPDGDVYRFHSRRVV
ncbi:MAG: 2-phosphosulfolactate phosphatase [Trueperaceae bacterium]|nr:MAG: 2-phosphosulfolactate phosphatase [Trueperaceae bacterium]